MADNESLSDDEIVRAIHGARTQEESDRDAGLRAAKAFYDAINDLVMIETTRGFRWGIPRHRIAPLATASGEELVQLTISPSGDGLHWDALDVQLSVPGLLVDALGAGTLAKELARRGGQSTSDVKADAARRNGARGGRPRTKSANSTAGGASMASKKGPSVHVVPSKTQPGKFVVKEAGKPQPVTRPASQSASIAKAVPIAKQNKSEVVVHRRDGTIRDSDSYGRDPNPPRDKKH
jgi:hypothetical protein